MFKSLNGQLFRIEQSVSVESINNLRNNIGLIETMLYKDGFVPLWKYHFKRLIKSIHLIANKSTLPSEDQLLEWIHVLIKENDIQQTCIIRMEYHLYEGNPFYLIETKELTKESLLPQQKLRIGIAASLVLPNNNISSLKTTFRQTYDAAQKQAKENGWYDALLVNDKNRIVESSISNIFWVKDGQAFTPPLSEGCVEGVFRTFLFDQLKF